MKAIIALEQMIKDKEATIKSIKKQLANHESGESKLSYMGLASAETNLERAQEQLVKHQTKLKELMALDSVELEEKEKVKDAVQRQNYLNYQKTRITRDVTRKNDEKLEAMSILDEIGQECLIEDLELYDIAQKSLSLNLAVHVDLEKKYTEVKNRFESLISKIDDKEIKDLGILNFRCILTILQFHVLYSNILENIATDNLPSFRGFPKYEDWWINELWKNHHAYYALFKWKGIISKQCNTDEQKRTWEKIFASWIGIKKILIQKGKLGYQYCYVFDTVLKEFAEIEEEISTHNLKSMDALTKQIIAKEDFTKETPNHTIVTKYVEFKREQLDFKE